MTIGRWLGVLVLVGVCVLGVRTAGASGGGDTASITVTAGQATPGFLDFIVITVDGPSGIRSTLGQVGVPTLFDGLRAGTYDVEVFDLGSAGDIPREGSATATVGEREHLDIAVTLELVGPPFPFPILLP